MKKLDSWCDPAFALRSFNKLEQARSFHTLSTFFNPPNSTFIACASPRDTTGTIGVHSCSGSSFRQKAHLSKHPQATAQTDAPPPLSPSRSSAAHTRRASDRPWGEPHPFGCKAWRIPSVVCPPCPSHGSSASRTEEWGVTPVGCR